jgi:N-formylmaleamate deformylase
VVEALGLSPASVLGHSMGARIAARLAARRPDLVRRCILADPPVSGPGRRPYPSPLQKYLDDIDAASRGDVPRQSEIQRRAKPAAAEWLPTQQGGRPPSHAAFHAEDMFADLPKIVCPALVYAGRATSSPMRMPPRSSLLKDGRKTNRSSPI